MIKLLSPRAYAKIKPLYSSAGKPIRCTDPCLVTPSSDRKGSCAHCRAVCTVRRCPQPVTTNGHSWYYDLSADHSLSQDPESLLVWLCEDCASRLAGDVQFAGTDALHDGLCWQCGDPVEHMERTTT